MTQENYRIFKSKLQALSEDFLRVYARAQIPDTERASDYALLHGKQASSLKEDPKSNQSRLGERAARAEGQRLGLFNTGAAAEEPNPTGPRGDHP